MTSPSSSPPNGPFVAIHLLDSAKGHAVQTWTFRDFPVIKIGRLDDNDIVLADPVVSRLHMILKAEQGEWLFESVGKHGVVIDDCRQESGSLNSGTVFRLGSNGPSLMFDRRGETATAAPHVTTTVEFGSFVDELGYDSGAAEEQVRKITDDNGFQRLLQQAAELKKRRTITRD